MSDLGKLEHTERIEKEEKPESKLKEVTNDVLECIKDQKSETPEKAEAFDGLAGCIEKLQGLTGKEKLSDVNEVLNECSDSLQEFKSQNEKLNKAIDDIAEKIKDISEHIEKDEELSLEDLIDLICILLKELLPIIMLI